MKQSKAKMGGKGKPGLKMHGDMFKSAGKKGVKKGYK